MKTTKNLMSVGLLLQSMLLRCGRYIGRQDAVIWSPTSHGRRVPTYTRILTLTTLSNKFSIELHEHIVISVNLDTFQVLKKCDAPCKTFTVNMEK